MSDAKSEFTEVPYSLAEDDDLDIEIIEVVGVDDDGSQLETLSDETEADEVVLNLDDGDHQHSYGSDADAVAALEPLPADPPTPVEEPARESSPSEPRTLNDRERLVRLQADFENFKRRSERERLRHEREATADLILRMLPVLDNFERALGADAGGDGNGMRAGVMLIFRQVLDELRKEGLKTVEALGRVFDPNVHEAVETDAESEYPPHTVIAELQRGYMLGGRLLRPALVRVAIDPSEHELQEELAHIGEDS